MRHQLIDYSVAAMTLIMVGFLWLGWVFGPVSPVPRWVQALGAVGILLLLVDLYRAYWALIQTRTAIRNKRTTIQACVPVVQPDQQDCE